MSTHSERIWKQELTGNLDRVGWAGRSLHPSNSHLKIPWVPYILQLYSLEVRMMLSYTLQFFKTESVTEELWKVMRIRVHLVSFDLWIVFDFRVEFDSCTWLRVAIVSTSRGDCQRRWRLDLFWCCRLGAGEVEELEDRDGLRCLIFTLWQWGFVSRTDGGRWHGFRIHCSNNEFLGQSDDLSSFSPNICPELIWNISSLLMIH